MGASLLTILTLSFVGYSLQALGAPPHGDSKQLEAKSTGQRVFSIDEKGFALIRGTRYRVLSSYDEAEVLGWGASTECLLNVGCVHSRKNKLTGQLEFGIVLESPKKDGKAKGVDAIETAVELKPVVRDKPGVAYAIPFVDGDKTPLSESERSGWWLKSVLNRNKNAGLNTRVIFAMKDKPLSQAEILSFRTRALHDPKTLYYIFESSKFEQIPGNDQIGATITEYPTERFYEFAQKARAIDLDDPGQAHEIPGKLLRDRLDWLEKIVNRNQVAGKKTKVIYSAHNCPGCQARKPEFKKEAKDNQNTLYYIFEIPDYRVGLQPPASLGGAINGFPEERDY